MDLTTSTSDGQAAVPAPDQTLSTDAGVALSEDDKPLSSYGLNGESATLFLTFRCVVPSSAALMAVILGRCHPVPTLRAKASPFPAMQTSRG